MKKRLNEAKGAWPDKLPKILWSICTIPNSGTLDTLFSLAFGNEAVIPTEVETKTLRVTRYFQKEKKRGTKRGS